MPDCHFCLKPLFEDTFAFEIKNLIKILLMQIFNFYLIKFFSFFSFFSTRNCRFFLVSHEKWKTREIAHSSINQWSIIEDRVTVNWKAPPTKQRKSHGIGGNHDGRKHFAPFISRKNERRWRQNRPPSIRWKLSSGKGVQNHGRNLKIVNRIKFGGKFKHGHYFIAM